MYAAKSSRDDPVTSRPGRAIRNRKSGSRSSRAFSGSWSSIQAMYSSNSISRPPCPAAVSDESAPGRRREEAALRHELPVLDDHLLHRASADVLARAEAHHGRDPRVDGAGLLIGRDERLGG